MRIKIRLLVFFLPILTACVTAGGEPPVQNKKNSAINVQLGIGYMQQNNFEQANQRLRRALDLDPDSSKANYFYALLQEQLQAKDVAEKHYKIAVELDSNDSVAANMYGKFLCLNGREAESEKYFLRAVDNSLYKTPEIAYTNAALCVLKMNQKVKAKTYFERALSAKSNFVIALIEMSALELSEGNFATAKIYIDRFHLVDRPTARSLWLEIRSELGINGGNNVKELGQKLESEFPNSVELKSWLALK